MQPKFAASRRRLRLFKLAPIHLSLALLTSGVWFTQSSLAPPSAQAYKPRVDVSLDRVANETYDSFIRRADLVARAAAQRSFDRDILAGEVSIMVMGRNQGVEAPVMLLDVSRQNWRTRPEPRRWATYYRTAQALLQLPAGSDAPLGGGMGQPIQPPALVQPATPLAPDRPSPTPQSRRGRRGRNAPAVQPSASPQPTSASTPIPVPPSPSSSSPTRSDQ
jgi:hypothetical protein